LIDVGPETLNSTVTAINLIFQRKSQHVVTDVAFRHSLYWVQDCGTLCLDCCMTLATTLLALDILWRHFFSQCTSAIDRIRGIGDYALYISVFYLFRRWSPAVHCVRVGTCLFFDNSWCRQNTICSV